MARELLDKHEPVGPQIGLAADKHDLLGAGACELADKRDAFRGGEFVGPRRARARSAMAAFQIAGQRDFPDDVARLRPRQPLRRYRPHWDPASRFRYIRPHENCQIQPIRVLWL